MRDYNNGIYRQCVCCRKRYWCEDGSWVCSSACDSVLEERFYKEQLNELEGYLDNLLCDFVGGYSKEDEFKKEWNMALYDSINIKDLDENDINLLARHKKMEYEIAI